MTPEESRGTFEEFLAERGNSVAALSALSAAEQMLAFYSDVRADDCALDSEGDMLLFQWGVYDWGEGPTWQYNLTRQFTVSADDSDECDDDELMSQLSLTVHFSPSDDLQSLEEGSRWCHSLAEIDKFKQFIRSHEATQRALALQPQRVTLDWSPV